MIAPAGSTCPRAPFLAETLVLIPALNEAPVVAETVAAWLASGAGGVLVVDNGSTDDTARLAREAGASVVREPRRGYGAAAWAGFASVSANSPFRWILFSSADCSDLFEPGEERGWQEAVSRGADLVLGDRCTPVESRRHLKVPQRVGSWIFRWAVGLTWGHWYRDMGSRRLLSRSVISRLDLKDRGFGWNVEMQVRAIECGLRVVELPASYRSRAGGDSKISGNLAGSLRATRGILGMLWKLARTRRRRRSQAGESVRPSKRSGRTS